MGPSFYAQILADWILKKHPSIRVDRIQLAYTIDAWADEQEPANDDPQEQQR